MKNTDNDDYKVIWGGATISQKEAKRVRVAFLFGVVNIVIIGLAFGIKNKFGLFSLSLVLAGIGYFGVAKRIYK